jgi:hypothetical protein
MTSQITLKKATLIFYIIIYAMVLDELSSRNSYGDPSWAIRVNIVLHVVAFVIMVFYLSGRFYKTVGIFCLYFFLWLLVVADSSKTIYHYFFVIPNSLPPVWWTIFTFIINLIYDVPAWYICYKYSKLMNN